MMNDGIKIDSEIIPDGKIHRFHIGGDSPKSINGWYVLYAGVMYSGAYGCWKRGIKKSWCSKSKAHMTFIESKLHRERICGMQKELSELRKTAKENAKIIWKQSQFASNTHPYLARKKVSSYGLRVDKKNRLIIPIYNSDNEICSLQFIAPNGEKRFLRGGSIATGYYFIGNQNQSINTIFIAEGYATCASIHSIMHSAVICCFNCNNLLAIAVLIKDRFPDSQIIIAADNDIYTAGNPGITKGKHAAKHISAQLTYPDFTGLNLKSRPTDFNDLMLLSDINRVKINLMDNKNKDVEL